MISSFTVGNFKALGAPQTVPLKPITLIFGPNSAGKSSLIHSLLFAHEALRTGKLDIHQTEIGGKSVDLGGFRQLTFRCLSENAVTFTFRIPEVSASGGAAWKLNDVEVNSVMQITHSDQTGIAAEGDEEWWLDLLAQHPPDGPSEENAALIERFMSMAQSPLAGEAVLRRFEIIVAGEPLVQASQRGGGRLKVDRFSTMHPAARLFIESLVLSYSTTNEFSEDDATAVAEAFNEILPQLELDACGFLARPRTDGLREFSVSELMMIQKDDRAAALQNNARLFIPRIVAGLFQAVFSACEGFFNRLDYLGPLRSYPPRHLAFASESGDGKAEGAHAWKVVLENSEVRKKINGWLSSDFLKTKYELGVNSLIPLHLAADALETEFQDIVSEKYQEHEEARGGHGERPDEAFFAPYESWDVSTLYRRMLWQILRRSRRSAVPELTLRDQRTGTYVSHRDIGIGVSQLLPVLVQAYGSTNRILAVEQPEIHLHPALQSELADVFIESALGEQKNTFLLETHSEHLILRLLRRVRETSENTLSPNQVPLRAEDLSVLYVQPSAEGSQVVALPVTPDGDFGVPWPGGFFAERFADLP